MFLCHQLCEAKLAHESCDTDIKAVTAQRDQYHTEATAAGERVVALTTQLGNCTGGSDGGSILLVALIFA